jgi:hypothetical protein
MPQTVDTPDIAWQASCQESIKTVQPLPSTVKPGCRQTGLLVALRTAMTWLSGWRVPCTPRMVTVPQPFELPIDRVARQHPFLYIKALSG